MSEALELGELAQDHSVAQMNVGGRGIDAQLHPQRPAFRLGSDQLPQQFSLGQDIHTAEQ